MSGGRKEVRKGEQKSVLASNISGVSVVYVDGRQYF